MCLPLFFNIYLMPLFSLISSTSAVAHPIPLYIGILFYHCFCCYVFYVFYLRLIRCILLLFFYYLKGLQLKLICASSWAG